MAAPWKWCEAGSYFLNKLALNGDCYSSSVHSRNLIALYNDLLLAWTQKEERLLAVSVRTSSNLVSGDDCQVLLLTNPPVYEVDNVVANRTHHLLLWGPRGITVVALPKACTSFIKEKALCRSWPLGEHFFLCSRSVVVTDAAWHPDSEMDAHVLVLTSDNHFRLYSITEPQAPQLILSVGVSPGVTSNIGASLGEDTAVSFDFGEVPAAGSRSRQVFLLMGSGDVYLTHVSPQDDNSTVHSGRVLGPLSMQPRLDDNYGVDGYSLVCLPGPVPVLVIATTAGTLYHCLALGMPQHDPFSHAVNQKPMEMSLFAFEKVKLDLTFTPGSEDDAFTCPVRLMRDPTCPLRYICSHNSGLHAVALPFIDHLRVFAEAEAEQDVPLQLRDEPCIVENLVCTRVTTSSKPTPLIGTTVIPWTPGPVLVVLTASWNILTNFLVRGYQRYIPQLISSAPSVLRPSPLRQMRSGFEQHVQQMLGGRAVPQLAQGATAANSTVQECLEILFSATQKFREEWLQRLDACQVLIARRMQAVKMQKDEQLEKQRNLGKEMEAIQLKDTELRKKYDSLYGAQQKIVKRVENVLHQLQQQVPVLSRVEESMRKELESMQERINGMRSSLEQARLKQDYQERHMDSHSTAEDGRATAQISNIQIDHIREALVSEGDAITELVLKIGNLKQELSV